MILLSKFLNLFVVTSPGLDYLLVKITFIENRNITACKTKQVEKYKYRMELTKNENAKEEREFFNREWH